jgi:CDP-archaeol synthase
MEHISSLLLLLITANCTPVLARLFFRNHFDIPLDCNKLFYDDKPFFGHTKTVRGILSSLFLTSLMAFAIDVPVAIGVLISCYAMTGDLLSSFFKRRLAIPSSQSAPVLDQLPESMLPLLMVNSYFNLGWTDAVIVLLAFFIVDLVLSYLLARFYENVGTR